LKIRGTRRTRLGLLVCVSTLLCATAAVTATADLLVGVSWSNFQEERWKTDEAALRAGLAELGARYLSTDAQSSSEKQIADVEGLIARGADVLILLAHDADAIAPALALADAEGIPVIAYDRLIETPGALYITFDNVEVGRMQARAILELVPEGNYVFIKGSPLDPNADFLRGGQQEVLQEALDSGAIVNVGEQYTDGWDPAVAQTNMAQILTSINNELDAVVASNDGTAGGVVAALAEQGLDGEIPDFGQDADNAALNRVARGTQAVSVWKDARVLGTEAANVAIQLIENGGDLAAVEGATIFTDGALGESMNSILLEPIPSTQANLNLMLEADWLSQEELCAGVEAGSVDVCP